MSNKESQWSEVILKSMEGSKRAKPDPTLLIKIKEMIPENNQVILSQYYIRYAAASVLFLVLNMSILTFLNQQTKKNTNQTILQSSSKEELFITFQIYDL